MNLNDGLISFYILIRLYKVIWSFFTNIRIPEHIASQDLNLWKE